MLCLAAWRADGIPSLPWVPRSDWVNVQDHGVAGDGKTDDTAALQELFNGFGNGSILYFPQGTYRITATLSLIGPATGTVLIGHGRDTRLLWDGPADTPQHVFSESETGTVMLRIDGFAHGVRYEGFVLDGNRQADVGTWHRCTTRFETEILYRNIEFANFRKAGFLSQPEGGAHGDRFATAETVFQNVMFKDCGTGASFTSFNDYNYIFTGCGFSGCGTGIACIRGNFYVRNTHFDSSSIVDIRSHPEHASSIRRTTSLGSRAFVHHTSSVAPLTIEDCHIGGWPAGEPHGPEGCPVVQEGVSMLIFDTHFHDAPDNRPPVFARRQVVHSGCSTENGVPLFGALRGTSQQDHQREQQQMSLLIRELPGGKHPRSVLRPQTTFLKDKWPVAPVILDAKRDFGAAGDGRTDDTDAIRRAIDAAREHGANAMAYLPKGNYVVSETLRMEGADYTVGGAGYHTRLLWRGEAGGTILAVHNPNRLKLEHIMIGHHDGGKGENSIDILHTDTERSSMTYEGVFTFGLYQKKPFERGFSIRGLSRGSLVVLDRVQGNLRLTDCARAVIFSPVSYEGSLVIEGRARERDGFIGFQSRLATIVDGGLYLRDNQSVVISDFYMEQSDAGWAFSGSPELPPGRATIQFPKIHLNERISQPRPPVVITNYSGEICIGPGQFFGWPGAFTVEQRGEAALTLTLLGSKFYETMADWDLSPAVRFAQCGNINFGPYDRVGRRQPPPQLRGPGSGTADSSDAETRMVIRRGLDDLRRLGRLDLLLNHSRD